VAFFLLWLGLYDDVHVLIEGYQEARKAFGGELAEVEMKQFTSGAEARFVFLRLTRR
jgi:hypothetical protein